MNEWCHIWRIHITWNWFVHEWVSFTPFVSCLQAVWQAQRAINTHELYHAKPGMWHVTYEQVTSRMHESRYIWTIEPMCVCTRHQHPWTLSQKTQVASYIKKSRLIWMNHVTHEWVTSRHIWIRAINNHELCHAKPGPKVTSCIKNHDWYEWVMSRMSESRHIWIRAINTHELYHAKPGPQITSCIQKSRRIGMSHVTYEWVTLLMNTRHQHPWPLSCKTRYVTHVTSYIKTPRLIGMSHVTYGWVMSHMNTRP